MYWTAALANFALVVGFAVTGVRRLRRGDVPGHRRAMRVAIGLVILFVLSYGIKLVVLGREDRADWSAVSIAVLTLHEACIAVMLVAGAVAASLARRFGNADDLTVAEPAARTRDRRMHRAAGRAAVAASALALLTAVAVLAGMYLRALA